MSFNDDVKLKGSMYAVLKKADGRIEVHRKDNMILNVGFDFIADAIGKVSNRPACMSNIAVGSGNAAPSASQTALGNEIGRKAATYSHTTGTKTFKFSAYFGPGLATGAITEAGVCNASSGGIFIDRVTMGVITKEANDELTMNFEFTLS